MDKESLLKVLVPLYWANCSSYEEYQNSDDADGWEYCQMAEFDYEYDWETESIYDEEVTEGYIVSHDNSDVIAKIITLISLAGFYSKERRLIKNGP